MRKADKQELIAAAGEARRRAVAPYSSFHVGAALRTATGRIVQGVNIESASYGLTCCAERVALFKALSEGERNFVALGIVARISEGPLPCGACRQLLAEYAPDAIILVADSEKPSLIHQFTIKNLLPRPFLSVPTRLNHQSPSKSRNYKSGSLSTK